MLITPDHESHYAEHGYAVVEHFLTPAELTGALADFDVIAPGWPAYVQDPTLPKPAGWDQPTNFGRSKGVFPYPGTHLNDITFHPEMRRFAQKMMGDEDLYCEQSHLSYKCMGHPGDRDQYMHLDYGNHTLAYPPGDPKYWQTAYLIYLSDVTLETAPTAVVSRQHYQEKILWPAAYSPDARPSLYDNEVKLTVPAGSLLIYSMRTFHRGTKFTAELGRLAMWVTYAPKRWRWLGIVGWSEQAPRKEFRQWLERASVAERSALGFPEPGHEYWTDETRAGVSARYPGMDMAPYAADAD